MRAPHSGGVGGPRRSRQGALGAPLRPCRFSLNLCLEGPCVAGQSRRDGRAPPREAGRTRGTRSAAMSANTYVGPVPPRRRTPAPPSSGGPTSTLAGAILAFAAPEAILLRWSGAERLIGLMTGASPGCSCWQRSSSSPLADRWARSRPARDAVPRPGALHRRGGDPLPAAALRRPLLQLARPDPDRRPLHRAALPGPDRRRVHQRRPISFLRGALVIGGLLAG